MNKDILSKEEYTHLQIFINDPIMKEAVRKVLTYQIYYAGTVRPDFPLEQENFANGLIKVAAMTKMTDEEIGKRLSMICQANGLVGEAFEQIEQLKEIKETKKDSKNPAR